MKSSTYLLLFGIFIAAICSCSSPKSLPQANYPPLIDSLAMRDTIPLFDWKIGDAQWKRMENLSVKTLVDLTNHPKGYIKFFALLSIFKKHDAVEKDSIDFFAILKTHAFDTSKITFADQVNNPPELVETITTGEAFLSMLGGYHFSSVAMRTGLFFPIIMLDTKERQYIDSLLICHEPFYNETGDKLQFAFSSNPNIRSCVLERIEKYGNKNYSISLAKFQNPDDIPLILENLPTLYNDKIRHTHRWYPFLFFQHPDLFNFLKEHWKENLLNRHYIQAIAKYQNQEAAIYLDSIYETAKNANQLAYDLKNVTEQNYNIFYADLFLKILKDNIAASSLRTENLADSLWKHRPHEMYQLYEKWQGETLHFSRDRVFNSFPPVAYYLEKNNPEILVEIIMKNVKNGSAWLHDMNLNQNNLPYLKYIKESENLDFGLPLFELLKNEKSGRAIAFFSRFLIDFNRAEFENKLKIFFDKNPDRKPKPWEEKDGNSWYLDFLGSQPK